VISIFATVAWMAVPGVSQAATKKHVSPFAGKWYVSLGDSYSVGYQPVPGPDGAATAGYVGYVATKLHITNVENFGCGGATTESILSYTGICGTGGTYAPPAMAAQLPDPVISGDTQVANAEAFIAAHPNDVGLVTISISGNDITSCVSTPNPVTCVLDRMNGTYDATYNPTSENIPANVTTLVDDIDSALVANGDTSAPIVGLTYPDVVLGTWVNPGLEPSQSMTSQTLAGESITAFDSIINPKLKAAYTSVTGGKFVDVTDAPAFGGNGTSIPSLSGQPQKGLPSTDAPTSPTAIPVPRKTKVPEAVLDICKLTFYCTLQNIHAQTKGYEDIGKLVKDALK
jgi:lysophospholipase L1-like esterase